ncbi:hypothetical protein FB639_003726 [Coemansia asiatica]|nr:hypothetical protein FB639_003726 [Coemansia asiatica]
MKRAHTPEGMVIHYENKLRSFLGLQQPPHSTDNLDDNDWLFVDHDAVPQPSEKSLGTQQESRVAATKGCKHLSNPLIAQGIRDNLVSEWSVQDSYTRLVVHTMCRYYGLVSFTSQNGKNSVLHICHPKIFNDSGIVISPEITFHHFLFGSKDD